MITLSIDGATEETYRKYRKGGNFSVVLENLNALRAAKRKLKKNNPIVVWQYLVFDHNVHEIELAKELARFYDVDIINIGKPFSVDWDDPTIKVYQGDNSIYGFHMINNNMYEHSIYNKNDMLNNLNKDQLTKVFNESWIKTKYLNENSNYEYGNNMCDWLYKNITMDAGGRIMPCCMSPMKSRNLVFSDINNDEINLYNSDMYAQARARFSDKVNYNYAKGTIIEDPYCNYCNEFYSGANINTNNIRQYLNELSIFHILNSETIDALTNW